MEKKNNIKIEINANRITNPYLVENGTVSPMLEAMNAIEAFHFNSSITDPLGMWTGAPEEKGSRPVQDADDL